MPIDWVLGLLGGLMIGCAGALYLLVNGRIMGASGIVGGLVDGTAGKTWPERTAFVAGLVIVTAILAWGTGGSTTNATTNAVVLVGAGLLVGFGTRLAGGCTSGHGACGISRLSKRGIVATLAYMAAGAATILIFRHGVGAI